MAEGIPLQVQRCFRPQYEEEEVCYYPPKDQCGGLQLFVEGYPLFHECLCQSCGTGEPSLHDCQCQRGQHQCGCRQPPAREGFPPQYQCRCRQVPVRDGHRPQDQDQCGGRQFPCQPQPKKGGQRKPDSHHDPPNPEPDESNKKPELVEPIKIPEQVEPIKIREPVEPNGASSPARLICACISIFLLLAGATILVLWLIYRPHKPRFTVVGAAIYDLNTTFPPLMSTTMQFTIIIKNPNKRVSIYYDKLSAFVSYKNQAITPEAMMPPLHMKKRSTVEVAPMIGGTPVQVSMEVANGLAIDEIYGVMGLKLVFTGRLRWKIGAIKTKHYGIYVNCDLMLDLKKGCVGPVPLLGSPVCNVDI